MKHFINVTDCTTEELTHVLDVGRRLRDDRMAGRTTPVLAGRTLAMYFEKPSLRTRVSFEQAMYDLGGHSIVLGQNEVKLGERETPADFARVVSGMVDGIMARVFEHEKLMEMAECGDVPVINALSDRSHPCQALADMMTIQDEFGADVSGRTVAFVGDGNNVALSLAALCARLGVRFFLAAPPGYQLDGDIIKRIHADSPTASIEIITDPAEAVREADAVYTDTFVSMGQEEEKARRLKDFAGFQLNTKLLAAAPTHAIVLHCLPAYRGVEITDEVIDGPQSRVFRQSHNRLHAQKGLLAALLAGA